MRDVAREWGTRGPSQGAAVLGPPCPLATRRLVTVVTWPREQPCPCLLGALVCSWVFRITVTFATLLSLLASLMGLVLKVITGLVQVTPCCAAIHHCLNCLVVTDLSIQTLWATWLPHTFCFQDKISHLEERISRLPCIYDPATVSPQLSLYSSLLSPAESIGRQGCVSCVAGISLPWSVAHLPFQLVCQGVHQLLSAGTLVMPSV